MKTRIVLFGILVSLLLVLCSAVPAQVSWSCSYEEAPTIAQTQHKIIMLYFTSPNNDAVNKFEATVLQTQSISSQLNADFVNVRLDIVKEPIIAARYHVAEPPVVIFLDQNGTEILRIYEFSNIDTFGKIAGFVAQLITQESTISLRSESPAGSYTSLASLTAKSVGKTVTVKGKILNAISPTSATAPYSYYITDGAETMRVVIWPDVFNRIPDIDRFKLGTEIAATGEVKEFYNKLEIHVNEPDDFKVAGSQPEPAQPPAPQQSVQQPSPGTFIPISQISAASEGKEVHVQGKIVNIKPSWKDTAPNTVTIQDQSGNSIAIVYWPDVGQTLKPDQQPRMDAVMTAKGTVSVFRDAPQVKVSDAGDIAIQGGAQPATSSQGITPIADISRNLIGQRVTIKGTITRAFDVNGGTILTVTDNTGSISVPAWDRVTDGLPDKTILKQDSTVTITGTVALFERRQEIQLEINTAEDIKRAE